MSPIQKENLAENEVNRLQRESVNGTDLPSLLAPDCERETVAKSRQAAVWRGEKPDRWPILVKAPLTAEQQRIPAPDLKEAFYDDDMMLCDGVRKACGVANARSDAVPSIRANLGTGVLLSCIGLEQDVFSEKMPWLSQHLTIHQISALEPHDIRMQGTFERGIQQMKRASNTSNDYTAGQAAGS